MQRQFRLYQSDQDSESAFAHAEYFEEMKSLFLYSVELEYRYAEDTMPRRVSGSNAPMLNDSLRLISNFRTRYIDLASRFAQEESSSPDADMVDLEKKRNFFMACVIEH